MRRMLTAVMALMLTASAAGARAQEGATAGSDEWATLVTANDLDVEGKTPFHLGMTFQLYDLDGKPTETGSVEEWWAAPGSQKVVVHLAGLDEDGSAPEGVDPVLVRDSYLVKQLLEVAAHPMPLTLRTPGLLGNSGRETEADKRMMGTPSAGELSTRKVKVGNVTLDCITPKVVVQDTTGEGPLTVCVEPQGTDVRILQGFGGKETVVRARAGKFRNTFVSLDLRVDYMGRDAIAGKLAIMQAFEPATSEVKLPVAEAPKTSLSEAATIRGGVLAGYRIKFVAPVYPELAKVEHASGSVLLRAIIGKDGVIRRLVPIASTSPIFNSAAMEAVKQWTYRPYLLNGEPTEVDTTITVNFQMAPN